MLGLSRRPAVDTHDTASFRSAGLRTLALRVLFGGGAIVLLAAAVLSARQLDPADRGLLPTGTTGVVVLDLSLSILDDQSGVVRRTLQSLVDSDAPVGVVVFSDVPYELLPPGTPSRELRPIIRLLTPTGSGKVVSPWSDTFRAGTRISTALQLAQDMLDGDRVKDGSILLVSDLETVARRRSGDRPRPALDQARGHAGAPARARPLERRPRPLRRHPRPGRVHPARRRPGPATGAAGRGAAAAAARRCSCSERCSSSRSPATSATPAGSHCPCSARRKAAA